MTTPAPIRRVEVPEASRLAFLPRIATPRFMLAFEQTAYNTARTMSERYCGGYWHYYQLDNGGAYLAPAPLRGADKHALVLPNGYRNITVSSDALGIICTLYAFSSLSFDAHERGTEDEADTLASGYHVLREYAMQHPEAQAILTAID